MFNFFQLIHLYSSFSRVSHIFTSSMALLKIKFPFQKRVRLAQGLWLMTWVAMVSGATTFALGVFLKTELIRRAEVQKCT